MITFNFTRTILTFTFLSGFQSLFYGDDYSHVKAQSNSIFDNSWTLNEGQISGFTNGTAAIFIENFAINPNDLSIIDLNGQLSISFGNQNCFKRYFVEIDDNGQGVFTIENITFNLQMGCEAQSDIDMINQLMGFMFTEPEDGTFVSKNPFSYNIVQNYDSSEGITTGYEALHMTNSIGDTAVFWSAVLSSPRFTTSSIALSPNPVQAVMHLSHAQTTPLQLQIYDIQGRMIQTQTLLPAQTQIEVQALNPGMYLAVFQNEKGERVSKKFLKQ